MTNRPPPDATLAPHLEADSTNRARSEDGGSDEGNDPGRHGALLRSVFVAMQEGLVVQRRDGTIVQANPASERILGLPLAQLTGRTSVDPRWRAEHEDGSPFPGHTHPAMITLATGQPQRDVRMWVHRPDGTRALLTVNSEPVPGAATPDGLPEHVLVTFADVTAKQAAELRERTLAAMVSDLYNNAPCGYHALDAEGRYLQINDTELGWLGVTREETVGQLRPTDFMTEASRATFARHFPRLKAEGEVREIEMEIVSRQGAVRTVSATATVVRDASGHFASSRSVLYDISDLVRLRRELLERSERDKQVVLENELIAVGRLHQRAFVWVNEALCRLFGYTADELIGQTTRILYPDEAAYDHVGRDVYRNFREGGLRRGQLEMVRKDGTPLWVDVHGTPIEGTDDVVVMFADLTPIRAAQERLLAAQRMESVGRLAGGVAHEFNNRLQAILGGTELALMKLPDDSPVRDDLLQIQESAGQAATITQQLAAYARKQPSLPRVLDVDDIVSTTIRLARHVLPATVRVTWAPEPGLWAIRADTAQITDALTNLLVNAREAMDHDGRIAVTARNVTFDERDAPDTPEANAGNFVAITVRDTGHGMPPDIVARAFEPFFTTKPFGQNSGLGLSTVYGIVTQHGGWVDIDSTVGEGTAVTMYLPRATAIATSTPSPAPATLKAALVVDADPGVRRIAQGMLRRLGYRAVDARDAEEALAIVRGGALLDVAIIDSVIEKAREVPLTVDLRRLRPTLRAVLMSAQAGDTFEGARDPDGARPLTKPFTFDQLSRLLRD